MSTKKAKQPDRKVVAAVETPKAQPKPRVEQPHEEYARRLAAIGSHLICADKLGVAPLTLSRRIMGTVPLAKETWLALRAVEEGLSETASPKE